jgi:hypothetical protein
MNKTLAVLLALSAAAVVFAAGSCTVDHGDAQYALRNAGYEDVRLGEDVIFLSGCGQGERGVKFMAKNVRGNDVAGTVCCGTGLSMKMCTVRF